MEAKKTNTSKKRALAQSGTLNRNADNVVDHKFKNLAFFDPNDIVQVKYEMLRSAQKDGVGVLKASQNFGFSRITFYKTEKAFRENGIFGLLTRKKGPRRAHKLTSEIMEFVEGLLVQKPQMRTDVIKEEIKERFGISVHKRSIERAIQKGKKKQ
jgi:transposase